jgi:DNA-binding MarR family transcriptional regulator
MSLQDELGLKTQILHPGHQAVLGVMLTGEMLAKEGSRLLRPFKLTDSQFNVLMLLKYQGEDDGGVSQTRLGRMLLVNRSNVTGLVDRLEQARLLERVAAAGDRRVKRVRLTAAGRKVVERAEQAYFARIEEVTGALNEDDMKRLGEALAIIRQGIRTREK